MDDIDEKDLLQRVMARDDKALLIIYSRHKQYIYNYIFRQLQDKETAEELTQDVFMDFIESLPKFRFQSSIKTFLFSIARYKTIDKIKKKKIKRVLFSKLPFYIVETLLTVIVDDDIEKQEIRNKIQKVFSLLPRNYELVLQLKYLDGHNVKTISSRLSLTFKATESLLFRARKAFIKEYKSL